MGMENLPVGSSQSGVFHASRLVSHLRRQWALTQNCCWDLSQAAVSCRKAGTPTPQSHLQADCHSNPFCAGKQDQFIPSAPPPKSRPSLPACSTEFSGGWKERTGLPMPPHQPQPQPGKGVSRGATADPTPCFLDTCPQSQDWLRFHCLRKCPCPLADRPRANWRILH